MNKDNLPDLKNKAITEKNSLSRLKFLSITSLALLGASCQRKKRGRSSYSSKGIYYRVKKGDTLYHIAKSCDISITTLMTANKLKVTELEVGQELLLPEVWYVPRGLSQPRYQIKSVPTEPTYTKQSSQEPVETDVKLEFVSRAEWGAAPIKSNSKAMGQVKRITLHHTHEYPGMNKLSDVRVIQSIARYHRKNLGWADIGYHFIIGRDGRVYEGRSSLYQGAHVGGHNENNLGISMMGNFMKKLPTAKQLSSLKKLLALKFTEYNLSADELYGHRDFKATECPGEILYSWLLEYKYFNRV